MAERLNQKKELRSFGLLMAFFIVIIFGLGLPLLIGQESTALIDLWVRAQLKQWRVNYWFDLYGLPIWPWLLAVFLSFWAFLLPIVLSPLFRFWMALGDILGWINTRIILGVLFYFLFMPLGLVLRLLGYDPMLRQLNSEKSYRQKSVILEKNHMEKPY